MPVYISQRQVTSAQRELDQHLAAGPDGRCLGCGQIEPCAAREALYGVFAVMGVLPRRVPRIPGHRRLDAAPGGFEWWATRHA